MVWLRVLPAEYCANGFMQRNYCLTENDDTVFVNIYASLEAETAFGKITIDSDYLNSGKVRLI